MWSCLLFLTCRNSTSLSSYCPRWTSFTSYISSLTCTHLSCFLTSSCTPYSVPSYLPIFLSSFLISPLVSYPLLSSPLTLPRPVFPCAPPSESPRPPGFSQPLQKGISRRIYPQRGGQQTGVQRFLKVRKMKRNEMNSMFQNRIWIWNNNSFLIKKTFLCIWWW